MEEDRVPPADRRDEAEREVGYETPVIEDLDSTHGPSVTAAGKTGIASPRSL